MTSTISPTIIEEQTKSSVPNFLEKHRQRCLLSQNLTSAVRDSSSGILKEQTILPPFPQMEKILMNFEKSGLNYLARFAARIRPTNDINAKDGNGNTVLYMAVYHSDQDTIKMLLSFPETLVNEENIYGNNPLLWAVEKGQGTIIELLLTHPKIDVMARTQWEKTLTRGKRAIKRTKNPIIIDMIKKKMREQTRLTSFFGF